MAKAVEEWTDARLNDLAAVLEPVPMQLALLSATVTHYEELAAHMETHTQLVLTRTSAACHEPHHLRSSRARWPPTRRFTASQGVRPDSTSG